MHKVQPALPGAPPASTAKRRWTFDIRTGLLIFLALFVAYFTLYPLLQVFYRSFVDSGVFTLKHYKAVFTSPRNYTVVWNSIYVSLAATAIATVIGTLVAFLVQRTDIPWKSSAPAASFSCWR